ncbi:class IV adenylate cyclase [Flavobacterium sp. JP2137]|uniref:class IV adenylate cyclase n=1 Tax=Flavobacterium sp. JP2137 TaxID=3414510 RepID=UPI003D2FAA39
MHIQNVEFKARVEALDKYEQKLIALGATRIGVYHQVDTYFNATVARLKLRESDGQNSLIHYHRADTPTAKESDIIYYQHDPNPALKAILTTQLGVKVVVDKVRTIYAIDSVRFHLDVVQQLGIFIEVEAMLENPNHSQADLKAQCDRYFEHFELEKSQLVDRSYSDLVLAKKTP